MFNVIYLQRYKFRICQCMCTWVCTWLVSIPTLQNMSHNSPCVISNTLILVNRQKRSWYATLFLISYFGWCKKKINLKSSIYFFELSWNCFCCFLWSWWQGEKFQTSYLTWIFNLYYCHLFMSITYLWGGPLIKYQYSRRFL